MVSVGLCAMFYLFVQVESVRVTCMYDDDDRVHSYSRLERGNLKFLPG